MAGVADTGGAELADVSGHHGDSFGIDNAHGRADQVGEGLGAQGKNVITGGIEPQDALAGPAGCKPLAQPVEEGEAWGYAADESQAGLSIFTHGVDLYGGSFAHGGDLSLCQLEVAPQIFGFDHGIITEDDANAAHLGSQAPHTDAVGRLTVVAVENDDGRAR